MSPKEFDRIFEEGRAAWMEEVRATGLARPDPPPCPYRRNSHKAGVWRKGYYHDIRKPGGRK